MWSTVIDDLNRNPAVLFAIGGGLAGLVVIGVGILWGSVHGKYITNLSLSLEMRRTRTSDKDKDDLITIIKLVKEPTNALTLETLKVELFRIDDDQLNDAIRSWRGLIPYGKSERRADDVWMPLRKVSDDHDLNHSLNCAGKLKSERRILAFWTPETGRAENLAPLEKTQYASYSIVDSNGAYEAVVTVIGVRYTSYLAKLIAKIFTLWFWQPVKTYYTASMITVPGDAAVAKRSDA